MTQEIENNELLRIDKLLVEKGLVESRQKAQVLVETEQVKVNGEVVSKVSTKVRPSANIELISELQYVGRGGRKLETAIDMWKLNFTGKVCADVGASTGGFTDAMLQGGAVTVYAIDVGFEQLHKKLQEDPRVISMEKTNVRHLESLPEKVDAVTIDVSFISVRLLLPVIKKWVNPEAEVLVLLKPQFEAPEKTKASVIKTPASRTAILRKFREWCAAEEWKWYDSFECPVTGDSGNKEYWVRIKPAYKKA